MENIAELFVEFFVEKLREKSIIITTRPLALFTGETLHHFSILLCLLILTETDCVIKNLIKFTYYKL